MPPIKGRMLGLQSGRMMATEPTQQQPNLDFRTVKNLGFPRKKSKFVGRGTKTNSKLKINKDEQLRKLRIPSSICSTLPSVKKFSNSRGFIDISEEEDVSTKAGEVEEAGAILGLKRGRGAENKYHVQALVEKRFGGMVWDVAFTPDCGESDPELLVSCGDRVFICDSQLNNKKQLDHIRLAGGIGFLSDRRIVVLCRFMDVINVYSPAGEFSHHFSCGQGPMAVAINARDEILVSDCSTKQILFYQPDGTLLRTVAPSGRNYTLKWPLYLATLPNSDFVVVDCHQQVVLIFDSRGSFIRTIPLRTYGGNEVLRPHGICLTPEQDLFIIDNAINSVEVFSLQGVYLQTLIPTEEGSRLGPKILSCNKAGYMAIGGLKGHLRLFKFVDSVQAKLEIGQQEVVKQEVELSTSKVKSKVNVEHNSSADVKVKKETKVKTEVKAEDDVTVIVLD